jgi:hypothetical protein
MFAVTFTKLLKNGTGLVRRPLGELQLATGVAGGAVDFFLMTAVELQFSVDQIATKGYTKLTPKQWAGPEAVWAKKGPVLEAAWTRQPVSNKSPADDPDPGLVATQPMPVPMPLLLAYYDSPGPPVRAFTSQGFSRVYVVQNFTAWIEATPPIGGNPHKISEVWSWYCITNMVNPGWEEKDPAKWVHLPGGRVDTGWADINSAPTLP